MELFYYFSIFIFGSIIGSFLNCLIFRLHSGESMLGRSHCMACKKMIAWHDNIPVLSWLMLLGRCRHCKKGISAQYPIVEAVVGTLFLIAFTVEAQKTGPIIDPSQFVIRNSSFLILLRDWFVISVMTIVFIYDLRWYLILDKVMIPSIVVIFLSDIAVSFTQAEPLKHLALYLVSAIIGGGFFLLQYLVSKGRWIGGGDIRLGFLIGLILGWPQVLLALSLAYMSGALVGVGLVLGGKKSMGSKLPFGVFLSVACLVCMFWGTEILRWYFRFSW